MIKESDIGMINLNNYTTPAQREQILKLYQSYNLHWLRMSEWVWRLNDVCEMYFRVSTDDELGDDDALCDAIEKSITDYLEDEYS